jgi:fatty acid synthase subunit alpha
VCAGELVALLTLTNVLNYLKAQKVDIPKVRVAGLFDNYPQLTEKFGLTKAKEMLKGIVNNCYDSAVEKQKAESYTVLERGLATIPLPGLDVPFHSRYSTFGLVSCLSGDVSEH